MKWNFSKSVANRFKRAGWRKNRDVRDKLELPTYASEYPEEALAFLYQYGQLKVEGYHKEFGKRLVIEPLYVDAGRGPGTDIEYLTQALGTSFFPLGYDRVTPGQIVVDEQCRVYLLGYYYTFFGNTIEIGFENLVMGAWNKAYSLNEKTGLWWDYATKEHPFESIISKK